MQLTDQQFRLVCPALAPARRAEMLPHLNAAMARFQINTKHRAAAYLANLIHESQSFARLSENLNYRASGLLDTFRKYFTPQLAAIYAHKPEKIASRVYANRMGNGDEASGDGWKYRGRGGIQRTGKNNYTRAAAALGIDCVNHPELLEQPRYAALSDALFWADNRLNQLADCLTGRHDANETKTLTAICRRINGGTNGLADRLRNYWRVLAVLERQQSATVADNALRLSISRSPLIPTPETHTPEEIAACRACPEKSQAAEAATVQEQERATRLIDMAERVPASAAKTMATSVWARTGGHAMKAGGTFLLALQAGSVGAWLAVAVVIGFLVFLVVSNRRDLKRWFNLVLLKGKDLFLEAA
jgi:putative chitinase